VYQEVGHIGHTPRNGASPKMTTNINRWHGIGVVVGDPEVRELSNNRSVAIAQIKIIEHLKDKQHLKDIEVVEFVRLVAFNNMAKHLAKYATPGTLLSARGRLHCGDRSTEIRLTEPISLELRNCETCKSEFFVRDRGQKFCKPECNPSAPGNESQPGKEQFVRQEILTPKSW
jgi:single-stranded DNA-binding protein